jgi:hypothetical protein
MVQVIVALAVVVVAGAVGLVLRRRQAVEAPTQPRYDIPAQLDRADFAPGVPWVVVVFTSATCTTCADVKAKAQVLASGQVAVVEAEYTASRHLHTKYDIQAVPILAVADADGVVRAGFAGPVTATDLWAAVAEARDPGVSPEPDLGR